MLSIVVRDAENELLRKELAKFKLPDSYDYGMLTSNMGEDGHCRVTFIFSSAKDAAAWFDTITEYGR